MKLLSLAVICVLLLVVVIPLAGSTDSVSAQNSKEQACKAAPGSDWVNGECVSTNSGSSVSDLLQDVTNVLLFLIGAVSVVMVIIGGFKYVVSGGDSTKVESAKNTIMYAIIGLVVAILAFAAVDFVIDNL